MNISNDLHDTHTLMNVIELSAAAAAAVVVSQQSLGAYVAALTFDRRSDQLFADNRRGCRAHTRPVALCAYYTNIPSRYARCCHIDMLPICDAAKTRAYALKTSETACSRLCAL